MSKKVVKAENICKIYKIGGTFVEALRGVSLDLEECDFIAIVGPSGSGKTTLLNILGLLDTPTRGKLQIDGRDVSKLRESELTKIRRNSIGFVFQTFNLVSQLTALENVEIQLHIANIGRPNSRRQKAEEALRIVGLEERLHHFPMQLSAGERQRVAIARAIAKNPRLLLADEPTGNLDSVSTHEIGKLMTKLNYDMRLTILVVTHNLKFAKYANKIFEIIDGKIYVR
jgi:putative ABC transport system ATP-binding protein